MSRLTVLACAMTLVLGGLAGCNKNRDDRPEPSAPRGPAATAEAKPAAPAPETPQAAPTAENTAAWTASKQYWNAFVNQSLQKLEATQRLREADPFARSTLLRSPDGKLWALLIQREEATLANRWLLLVQNAQDGKLEQTYDFIRAHAVEKMEWSADSISILILERSYDQREAAGRLWVVRPSRRSAYMAEDWVTAFSLAPNGKDLLIEKAGSSTKPFWPRTLAAVRLDRLGQEMPRPLTSLAYPDTQLGKFGPWVPVKGSEGDYTVEISLRDYQEGSFDAKERVMVYSTKTGELVEKKG